MSRHRTLSIRSLRRLSGSSNNNRNESTLGITCGIDWAEAHHDVALVDAVGATVAKLRIDTGLAGFTALMALIAEHTDDPESVPVAIETDKNLIVAALQAAGLTVYAINPRAVARYRERSAQAGGKSDPGRRHRAGEHLAHRCAHASGAAMHQRGRPGGQGAGPPTPRGDLGPPAHREPSALGAARVLSQRPQGVPRADAQGRARSHRHCPVAGARSEADPQASRDTAAAQRPRRPTRAGRDDS